jgi:outer membrane protein TolC
VLLRAYANRYAGTALLQIRLQEINLNTLQLTAGVDLICALGGGWKSE